MRSTPARWLTHTCAEGRNAQRGRSEEQFVKKALAHLNHACFTKRAFLKARLFLKALCFFGYGPPSCVLSPQDGASVPGGLGPTPQAILKCYNAIFGDCLLPFILNTNSCVNTPMALWGPSSGTKLSWHSLPLQQKNAGMNGPGDGKNAQETRFHVDKRPTAHINTRFV